MIPAIDVRHIGRYDPMVAHRARLEAAPRAINRALTSGRAAAVRLLQAEYGGLRAAQLRPRVKINKATRAMPRGSLVFSGRRIQLYGNFGMRAVGNWGVRFRKLPWRLETIDGDAVTPEMLARAFRQRSRRGGRASVFARHTRHRESFEVLVAPGVARALTERRLEPKIRQVLRSRYAVVFEQEMKFRLTKRATP